MKIILSTSLFYSGKMYFPGNILTIPDEIGQQYIAKKIANLYQQVDKKPESSNPSVSPAPNKNIKGASV